MEYQANFTGEKLSKVVNNSLLKGNTDEFIPAGDFDPATKKYVDIKSSAYILIINQNTVPVTAVDDIVNTLQHQGEVYVSFDEDQSMYKPSKIEANPDGLLVYLSGLDADTKIKNIIVKLTTGSASAVVENISQNIDEERFKQINVGGYPTTTVFSSKMYSLVDVDTKEHISPITSVDTIINTDGTPFVWDSVPGGLARLDDTGKVPESVLPSYVDDVLEGTLVSDTVFNDLDSAPYAPESGKIYVDTSTNRTYRWSGSIYSPVNSGLALGETAATAYSGDKGAKNAADIKTLKESKSVIDMNVIHDAIRDDTPITQEYINVLLDAYKKGVTVGMYDDGSTASLFLEKSNESIRINTYRIAIDDYYSEGYDKFVPLVAVSATRYIVDLSTGKIFENNGSGVNLIYGGDGNKFLSDTGNYKEIHKQVTVSTAEPTAEDGQDGDIWVTVV